MKALLWDNDGVLVDTEALYFAATRDVLAEVGVELTRTLFSELSLREGRSCFDLALQCGESPARVAALRCERNDRYMRRLQTGVDVLPGVREALSLLHGRVPMAIVTSARRDHFECIHADTGLLEYFEFALTPDQYRRSKPDPDPYRTAAARIGVAPGDALAIEDTARGLASAVAAGMPCAVIPHALTRDQDFSAAVRVLDRASQVPGLMSELG